jgi:hypothetical protein
MEEARIFLLSSYPFPSAGTCDTEGRKSKRKSIGSEPYRTWLERGGGVGHLKNDSQKQWVSLFTIAITGFSLTFNNYKTKSLNKFYLHYYVTV